MLSPPTCSYHTADTALGWPQALWALSGVFPSVTPDTQSLPSSRKVVLFSPNHSSCVSSFLWLLSLLLWTPIGSHLPEQYLFFHTLAFLSAAANTAGNTQVSWSSSPLTPQSFCSVSPCRQLKVANSSLGLLIFPFLLLSFLLCN